MSAPASSRMKCLVPARTIKVRGLFAKNAINRKVLLLVSQSLPECYPFPTRFSKGFFYWDVNSRDCVL